MSDTVVRGVRCPVCGGEEHRSIGPNPDFSGVTIVRCTSCTLMWSNPAPAPDDLSDQYDGAYVHHHPDALPPRYLAHKAARAAGQDAFIRAHADLDRFDPLDLLDIGSGIGALLEVFGARPDSGRLVGIEPSSVMRARARASLPERVELLDGLFGPERFAPASFDLVTGSHVLEHLADPVRFLADVRRVVRPGGYLFMEVPHEDEAEVRRIVDARLRGPMHLLFLDRDTFVRAVTAAGWEVRAVRAFGPSRDTFSIVPPPRRLQPGPAHGKVRRLARTVRARLAPRRPAEPSNGTPPPAITVESFAEENDPEGIWLRLVAENPGGG